MGYPSHRSAGRRLTIGRRLGLLVGLLAVAMAAVATFGVLGIGRVEHKITISIGVATAPDHGGDVEVVSRLADRALYAAKEAGRNRVQLAAITATPDELGAVAVEAEPALP